MTESIRTSIQTSFSDQASLRLSPSIDHDIPVMLARVLRPFGKAGDFRPELGHDLTNWKHCVDCHSAWRAPRTQPTWP